MPDYEAVTGVDAGDIEAVNSVAKSSIQAINGLGTPSEEASGLTPANTKSVSFGGVLQQVIRIGDASDDSAPSRVLFDNTSDTASDNVWSLTCWVKTAASYAGSYTYFAGNHNYEGGSGHFGTNFGLIAGRPIVAVTNEAGTVYIGITDVGTVVNDGNWHHIAYTYAGGGTQADFKCYVNGANVTGWTTSIDNAIGKGSGKAIVPPAGSATDGEGFTLGAYRSNGQAGLTYIVCKLDEVALWDVELSAADVSNVYGIAGEPPNLNVHAQASKLVHWWRLGDHANDDISAASGSGATAATSTSKIVDVSTAGGYARADGHAPKWSSGSGQVNIVVDAPSYSGIKSVDFAATADPILNDGVLSFDPKYAGSTPSASGPIYNALEYNNAFSLSFWLKTAAADETSGLAFAGRWDSGSYKGVYFHLNYSLPRVEMAVDASNYHSIRGGTTIDNDAWRHVVYTYDGSGNATGWSIYVDGSAETVVNYSAGGSGYPTHAISSSVKVNDECFTLGNLNLAAHAAGEYKGGMSNVSVWDVELSSSEVTALYNSDSLSNLNTHSQAANLISWWKMGDNAGDLLGSTVPGSNTANLIVDCSTAAGFARSDGTAYERSASGEVDIITDSP